MIFFFLMGPGSKKVKSFEWVKYKRSKTRPAAHPKKKKKTKKKKHIRITEMR